MSQVKLYGHPVSPYVRKARTILLLKGIEHEFKMVTPGSDDAEFRAASPLGKIPAFRDDHTSFADSTVIFHYLNRFYEGPTLLPESRAGYARALWFEEYADTVLTGIIGGHLFAEVVLAERLFRRAPIQADIDKALNVELPAAYKLLDASLDGTSWLAGDEMSIGDVAVGGLMVSLHHCGQTIPDSAPNLAGFVDRYFALEAVQTVLAAELQALAMMKYDSPLAKR